MIKFIDKPERLSMYEAENKYKNCNILMINPQKEDDTVYGEIYAVSDSVDSHNELLDAESELIKKGIKTTIGGEYKDSLGVDYLKMVRIA